ncbi:MAG: phosphatidylserine decarboxylase, partial [Sphingomonadales bacterium]
SGKIVEWHYDKQDNLLRQGDEMGRFLLGSTIVMLFPPDSIVFNPDWAPERPVRLGEAMGNRPPGKGQPN